MRTNVINEDWPPLLLIEYLLLTMTFKKFKKQKVRNNTFSPLSAIFHYKHYLFKPEQINCQASLFFLLTVLSPKQLYLVQDK